MRDRLVGDRRIPGRHSSELVGPVESEIEVHPLIGPVLSGTADCDALETVPGRNHCNRLFRSSDRSGAARALVVTRCRATAPSRNMRWSSTQHIRQRRPWSQPASLVAYFTMRTASRVTSPSPTSRSTFGRKASIFSSASTISITRGRSVATSRNLAVWIRECRP